MSRGESETIAKVQAVLDAAGIAHTHVSWAPLRPPAPPYALILDEVETLGADSLVMAYCRSVSIELYTDGKGEETCGKLAFALADAGFPFHRSQPVYLYSEKLYETTFDLGDFYEKRSSFNDLQAGE